MMRKARYRLYIDETGEHHVHSDVDNACYVDKRRRYLALCGVICGDESYRDALKPTIDDLKRRHFRMSDPDEPVILHRDDLVKRKGPFGVLKDDAKRAAFDRDFLDLLDRNEFTVVSVTIDKNSHAARYGVLAKHPYHYCLEAMLERYCYYLSRRSAIGDVMAESRQKKENSQLSNAYEQLYSSGTAYQGAQFIQEHLPSKKLKIKPKSANVIGLQVADLLAYTAKFDTLIANREFSTFPDVFSPKLRPILNRKYDKHASSGRVDGYGRVFLRPK